ncbi:MAG: outer membrane beta-barrel protein [Candidatus Binatia bacterium]
MHKFAAKKMRRDALHRRVVRRSLVMSLFFLLAAGPPAGAAGGGPFIGVDLGVSEPANNNYRAQVKDGATGNPYFGYMLNHYLGAQGQFHFVFQEPDNDRRGFPKENQITTLFGFTIGPRIALPLSKKVEIYGTGQGGFFTGLSGRFTRTDGGVSAGGGLDYYVTPRIAVSIFGRWNSTFMSPRPFFLSGQRADQQGPADATWVTAGMGVKYRFHPPTGPLPWPARKAK